MQKDKVKTPTKRPFKEVIGLHGERPYPPPKRDIRNVVKE